MPQKSTTLDGNSCRCDPSLTSQSQIMRQALALADAVANRTTTVLLVGETGTGKNVIARHIHQRSTNALQPYLEVNCAAIQYDLTESELFGYERGAFTGAVRSKPGLFEAAFEGTLLLDEIGEMDIRIQAKLLNTLESRTVRRIGATKSVQVAARIIAATNRDLSEDVSRGRFREDLFHRLSVFTINIPPLRARTDEIALIADHFLRILGSGVPPKISPQTLQMLKDYHWPGNVRELRNVIERALIVSGGASEILPSHLQFISQPVPQTASQTRSSELRVCELENAHILDTIRRCSGNICAAAKVLGVSRATIYRRARRFGLSL